MAAVAERAEIIFKLANFETDLVAEQGAVMGAWTELDGYVDGMIDEGDASTELILQGAQDPNGGYALPGYTWTAMGPANAIPAVVDAPPGFMSHNELGLMPLRGVIRP